MPAEKSETREPLRGIFGRSCGLESVVLFFPALCERLDGSSYEKFEEILSASERLSTAETFRSGIPCYVPFPGDFSVVDLLIYLSMWCGAVCRIASTKCSPLENEGGSSSQSVVAGAIPPNFFHRLVLQCLRKLCLGGEWKSHLWSNAGLSLSSIFLSH